MQSLFRPQSITHATQRLDGAVLVSVPVAAWVAVALVVGAVVLGAWLAGTVTYTRNVSVPGWLAPQRGVARAVALQSGTVTALFVSEGDVVDAGAPIARISSSSAAATGSPALFPPSPIRGEAPGTSTQPSIARDVGGFDVTSPGSRDALVHAGECSRDRDAVVPIIREPPPVADASQDLDGGRYVVTAPISGRVEVLTARVGETVRGTDAVAVLAARGELVAEILVPPAVAGFVAVDQSVRLHYDALPFGRAVQRGIVTHIAGVAVVPAETAIPGISPTGPVHQVRLRLPAQRVDVGGMSVALRAGMLVTADIPSSRRTILDALFDRT